MSNIVQKEKSIIQVENISKIYKLYDNPSDRLKESIHPLRKNIIGIFMLYKILALR